MKTTNQHSGEPPRPVGDRTVPTTTVSATGNRYRVTIPAAVGAALGVRERGIDSVTVRPRCTDGLALDVTLGADSGTAASQRVDRTEYQLQTFVPHPLGAAWGLGDATVRWPAPEDCDMATSTITVGITDWTPRGAPAAPASDAAVATLGEVDASGQVEGTIPRGVWSQSALGDGTVGWAAACVDGRPGVVLRRDAPAAWPTLALRRRGAGAGAVVFGGGGVATALGVRAGLESMGVRWSVVDGGVVGVLDADE